MDRTPTNVGYCDMCGRLFVLANKKGYSSYDFVKKLMNSELAEHLFNKDDNAMWLGETYVMSSLEYETDIEVGLLFPMILCIGRDIFTVYGVLLMMTDRELYMRRHRWRQWLRCLQVCMLCHMKWQLKTSRELTNQGDSFTDSS